MAFAKVVPDESDKSLRWLEVSHNGASWTRVEIRNDEEALQIISALQQCVQRTADPACKHEHHESVWHCFDCGEYV